LTLTVFILGPAGSGKSTFTSAFSELLDALDIDVLLVNLDPAVEETPYQPDIDVRDYVTVKEIMKERGLGPNGAIIEAIDELTLYVDEIKKEVYEFKPGYVIYDTPGQMELFAFRASGVEVVSKLSGDRSSVVFLFDSLLSVRPSSFVSLMLLAASTHYRLAKPQLIVLNKIDLLDETRLAKISEWVENPDTLSVDLEREGGPETPLHESIVRALADYLSVFELIPVSSTKGLGLEKVYSVLQEIYVGGEDYTTLPP